MRVLSILAFCALAALSAALTLLLVLLGMAPGVPPLDYTGLFMYGPGPGFFLLPIWLGAAILARVAAVAVGRPAKLAAWGALGLLLGLQGLMIADFRGVI